jgi:RND family efflux transporter MFP subunit
MELLLALIYVSFCYVIFKIFKIPVNQWSLATATLGGLVGIAMILVVMNYNHPFTKQARIYFVTTPIIPDVKGRVLEVPVEANQALKPGDVLFKIDPTVYQAEADSAKAQVAEALANRDRSKQAFERYESGNRNALKEGRNLPYAEIEVENRRGVYLAAEASSDGALAKQREADFNLAQTTVRAPTAGYVTQVGLRPGMMAVPLPLRPVMTFVHTDDRYLTAAFQQNSLQRVKAGDDAEVAFDAVPGRIFKGKVTTVIDAIAQGQIQAGGLLIDPEQIKGEGRALAIIGVTDDLSQYQIPMGAAAQVALITHHWHHLSLLRRILLRMISWKNFIFLEAH